MNCQQKINTFFAKLWLCVVLCLAFTLSTNAQLKDAFSTRLLNDTLVAATNKDFLYNTITLTNNATEKINITATITAPGKWQMVSDNVISISLDPGASQIVTMRLRPGNGNTATWQQVKIEYRVLNTGEIRNEFFNVRVQEFTKFKAVLTNPNMVLPSYQRNINIPVYIKNSGNVENTYNVAVINDYLHIDSKTSVTINAAADTTYLIPLTITEHEYALLKKEEIKIVVGNKTDLYNLNQTLSKIASVLKDHKSAFEEMPLQLEMGSNYLGKTIAPQFYAGLYGSLDLSKNDRLAFSFRSNTISSTQSSDNGMFKVDYTGAHAFASVGNVMEMTDFPANGYGLKVGYNWNSTDKLVLFGIIKSKTGDNNLFGGLYTKTLNSKVRLNGNFTTDLDRTNKQNSGIVKQNVTYKIDDSASVTVVTGGSLQQNNFAMVDNNSNTLLGSSLGYDFKYLHKNFNLTSTIVNNSNSFAGISRGQRTQSHDMRIVNGNFFSGLFYENSYNKQNNFFDSILIKDIFNISTNSYGLKFGWSAKNKLLFVTLGNQKQTQTGEGDNFQTNYKYLNLTSSLKLARKFSMNFSSYAGLGSVESKGLNNVFSFSTQGTLVYAFCGLNYQYARGPFFYNDFVNYLKNAKVTEHIIASPYIDINLYKSAFSGRVQFNYSTNTGLAEPVSTFLMNLGYNNVHKGYEFHLTGSLPTNMNSSSSQPNITATMRCRIVAPCPVIKKYNTIKLFLFKDANNDGIRQDDEEPIAGQTIAINGNLFISDEEGMIVYKNVNSGEFKLDMGYTSKVKGWSPSAGNIQQIIVDDHNVVKEVPYRKSRVLEGSLKVIIDSNSGMRFSPGNIKVTVTTSGSSVYTTLTDDLGNFSFNLPEGVYTVSLNPASFDEYFRPAEMSKTVDLSVNESKKVYFEIRQKKRQINIRKK